MGPTFGDTPVVLIVDDEPEIRHLLRMALDGLHVEVKMATSAEDGMKIVEEHPVDVAIIDIFMPGKGGIWIIRQLQKHHRETGVIAISGGHWDATPEKVKRALGRMGVGNALTKPFCLNQIRDMVGRFLPRAAKPIFGDATRL